MFNSIRRRLGTLLPRRSLASWLATEAEIAGILGGARGLAESAPRLMAALGSWLDVDAGALWLPDYRSERLVVAYLWQAEGRACPAFAAAARQASVARGEGLAGAAWAAIGVVVAEGRHDARSLPDTLRVAAQADRLRGGVAFAVRAARRVHGVVEFAARRRLRRSPEGCLALEVLGESLGQFVERTSALQRLRSSEHQLADLFENAPLALRLFDGRGRILRANQAELEMLGYAQADYARLTLADVHADAEGLEPFLERLRRGEDVRGFEARIRRADGTFAWHRLDANAYFEDGRLVHVRCFSRDVTDEREADLALKEREARLRHLVEGARGYAIHTCDARGGITAWSDGATALFGHGEAEARLLDVAALFAPEARAAGIPARVLRLTADEGRHRYEGWLLRRDGSRFWADVTFEAVHDPRGRLAHICQLTRDGTEDRRVAAVRTKTAEIVAANAGFLAAQQRDDELLAALRRAIDGPIESLQRAAASLDGSLDGSRADLARGIATAADELQRAVDRVSDPAPLTPVAALDVGPVDPSLVAAEVRDLVADAAAERRVRVEVDIDRELPPIECSAERFRLALYNLTSQAVRNSRDRGRVTVRLLPEGEAHVRLEVEDTGVGADESVIRALLDGRAGEDATVDPSGALRATRRIVAELAGRVAVRSVPGRGTVVSVVLPARRPNDGGGAAASEPGVAEGPRQADGRLLVVTPDAAARAKLAWTFGNAGLGVTSAAASEEGLVAARERRFDTVAAHAIGGDLPLPEFVAGLRGVGPSRSVGRLVVLFPADAGPPGALVVNDVLRRPLPADRAFATLERLQVRRGSGRTIFVVDGDLRMAEATARLIEALGYRAVAEPDADAALRQAAHEPPAVVFMGPRPLSLDVFAFAHHLRRQRGCADVALVLLLPLVLDDDDVAALRAAAGGPTARLDDVLESLRRPVRGPDAPDGASDPRR